VDDGPDAVEKLAKPVHDPVDSPVNKPSLALGKSL
jgi:hypothetical protein